MSPIVSRGYTASVQRMARWVGTTANVLDMHKDESFRIAKAHELMCEALSVLRDGIRLTWEDFEDEDDSEPSLFTLTVHDGGPSPCEPRVYEITDGE